MNNAAKITSLIIYQTQFSSFADITKIAKLDGYDEFLKQNKKSNDFLFSGIKSTEPREVILYWEGYGQIVPGGSSAYSYFVSRGYRIMIQVVHSSIFINTMHLLSETKLRKLGIPNDVDIIFPMPSVIFSEKFDPCFLRIRRNKGIRLFDLVNFKDDFYGQSAFILEKNSDDLMVPEVFKLRGLFI